MAAMATVDAHIPPATMVMSIYGNIAIFDEHLREDEHVVDAHGSRRCSCCSWQARLSIYEESLVTSRKPEVRVVDREREIIERLKDLERMVEWCVDRLVDRLGVERPEASQEQFVNFMRGFHAAKEQGLNSASMTTRELENLGRSIVQGTGLPYSSD